MFRDGVFIFIDGACRDGAFRDGAFRDGDIRFGAFKSIEGALKVGALTLIPGISILGILG
jgi:hypothetical protein